MKRLFAIVLCLLSIAVVAHAKEMSVKSVLSDGEKYADKSVTVKGDFLYSEAARESFTLGQGDSTLEVFYRDLPGSDKLYVLSLLKNKKTSVIVTGMLRQYANRQRFYFLEAASLTYEGGAAPDLPAGAAVSYFDVQANPAKYLSKPVTMRGLFVFSEPMRQSFTFEQNGNTVEVILSDLSKIDRERILAQKKNSKIPVTVSGLLQAYANDEKRFFITAYAVTLGN